MKTAKKKKAIVYYHYNILYNVIDHKNVRLSTPYTTS